jgi:hypothetical protein
VRRRLAQYLYGDGDKWVMQRIAEALNVSVGTVSGDLEDFNFSTTEKLKSHAKTETNKAGYRQALCRAVLKFEAWDSGLVSRDRRPKHLPKSGGVEVAFPLAEVLEGIPGLGGRIDGALRLLHAIRLRPAPPSRRAPALGRDPVSLTVLADRFRQVGNLPTCLKRRSRDFDGVMAHAQPLRDLPVRARRLLALA